MNNEAFENPEGYYNPEEQNPEEQGNWEGVKFANMNVAYEEYKKLTDPNKRYPIPDWLTPFAEEYEREKLNNSVSHDVINQILVAHNDALAVVQNRLKQIPDIADVKYKPPGSDEYLSIKEVFDDIYKKLEELR